MTCSAVQTVVLRSLTTTLSRGIHGVQISTANSRAIQDVPEHYNYDLAEILRVRPLPKRKFHVPSPGVTLLPSGGRTGKAGESMWTGVVKRGLASGAAEEFTSAPRGTIHLATGRRFILYSSRLTRALLVYLHTKHVTKTCKALPKSQRPPQPLRRSYSVANAYRFTRECN